MYVPNDVCSEIEMLYFCDDILNATLMIYITHFAKVPFVDPLEIPGNQRFSHVFRGYRKEIWP